MYDYILFDLDGTLTDPAAGITNSIIYALNKFDIAVTCHTELYAFIGPPLKDSFMKYYGFSDEKALLAIDYYREYFSTKGLFENSVYDGISDMLHLLKKSGKKILLATSKPEVFAVRILKHFDIYKYFDFVGGATLDGVRGEKTDVIKYVLDNAAITDTNKAIMVGDREYDVLGAAHFGMDSIGVTYGYGSLDELKTAGATYIIDKPLDILKYI